MRDEVNHDTGAEAADDPDALMTAVVGVIGSILLVVIIVGLEALFYWTQQREYERKVISARPVQLRQVQAENLEKIHGYRWIDEKAGVAAIPIDEAIEQLVEEKRAASGG